MARIRVLLIEDNRLLREGIANVLNDHDDFDGMCDRRAGAIARAPIAEEFICACS